MLIGCEGAQRWAGGEAECVPGLQFEHLEAVGSPA